MANFLGIVDSDAGRRGHFIQKVKDRIAPLDGLRHGYCESGDFGCTWAANRHAPVHSVADEEGAAILWGEAFNSHSGKKIDIETLRQVWQPPAEPDIEVLDGYFAGVIYHPIHGLIVGGDLLGIFPIYYYESNQMVLVASSPELFKHHPCFEKQFNPRGLVGILLSMHMFGGETLFKGVKRLQPGCVLFASGSKEATEVKYYQPPVSQQYFSLPFSIHVDLLNEAIEDAIKSQVDVAAPHTLLLSGGLDSRMLAGYLKKRNISIDALTLGVKNDQELQIAGKVARCLDIAHRFSEINNETYPIYADLQTKWEHLVNGFNTIHAWGIPSLLNTPKVITGYILDGVVGTSYLRWAFSSQDRTMSFDSFFEKINAYGIRFAVLQKLLRSDIFGDTLQEVKESIRQCYENYSDMESQRVWCFNLYHRQRFHVGPILWRLSFGSWPVSPVFSRNVLETAGGMPAATIADRKGQQDLLCRKFQSLASIPMDRNSFDTLPLLPGLRHYISRSINHRLKKIKKLPFIPDRQNREELRRYYRIYDPNNPGWRAVRETAEPNRKSVMHLFNEEVFNRLVPPPEEKLNCKDAIVDSSGPKLLLGFMLWAKENLS
jgi:asparagine synthase (glutamine-hydrolysing)